MDTIKKRVLNCFKLCSVGFFAASTFSGCEKIVKIDSPNSELIRKTIFSNEETSIAALAAPYGELRTGGFASGLKNGGMNFIGGLSSDELIYIGDAANIGIVEIFTNVITASNPTTGAFWTHAYKVIYAANALLEGIADANGIGSVLKERIQGEALFIRAFCHFYLVNSFGDIPYIKSTDYQANTVVTRIAKEEVYRLIENDLLKASDLLGADYAVHNGNRTHPICFAADALLARLYIYEGDWSNAEKKATSVIDNSALYELTELTEVFKANSKEAIWQLEPISSYTWAGASFIPNPATFQFNRFAMLTEEVLASFEPADSRRIEWVGQYTDGDEVYYYPHKYKKRNASAAPFVEYGMVLRLAEQYLIRAEACAHLGKTREAIADLDSIRFRADLPSLASRENEITQDELLKVIANERRVELLAEWGHRWFDLKRTGTTSDVLATIKPSWRQEARLFPIPENEILTNPNLNPQNPGY